MKSYVITIMDMPESVKAAERCIASMPEFDVQMFPAITPKDNPVKLAESKGIDLHWFMRADGGKFSRMNRCVAAFMSHHTLWEMCIRDNEEYQIFEHDAVRVGNLPMHIEHRGTLTIGAPSYGAFLTPHHFGVQRLMHKQYFGGAHAYRMKPKAAVAIVDKAKEFAAATDVFLSFDFFPWLQEYYPWPVIAKDSFSTIQKEGGCVAKHGYNPEKYKIL